MSDPKVINGCCKNTAITKGTTYIMFDKFRYQVTVDYCKNCGSKKATSHIEEVNSVGGK